MYYVPVFLVSLSLWQGCRNEVLWVGPWFFMRCARYAFFDVARIIAFHKPKIVFLENVKNLLSHNKGETFKTIKATLENLGYATETE